MSTEEFRIDLYSQDTAALALYNHEHEGDPVETWEYIDLPTVLEYRTKANRVLAAYFKSQNALIVGKDD